MLHIYLVYNVTYGTTCIPSISGSMANMNKHVHTIYSPGKNVCIMYVWFHVGREVIPVYIIHFYSFIQPPSTEYYTSVMYISTIHIYSYSMLTKITGMLPFQ